MAEENAALKIAADVSDLLHKLLSPGAEKLGLVLGYKLHPWAVQNFVTMMKKTARILQAAGLPANAVPPRLLIPIAQNSSLEEDDSLQEMWAGLLATASQQGDSVSPSFIETLKQLTPDDARHLELICQDSINHFNSFDRSKYFGNNVTKIDRIFDGMSLAPWAFGAESAKKPMEFVVPPSVYPDPYERIGLIRRTVEVKSSFDRRQLTWADDPEQIHHEVDSEVDGWYEFTEYCIRFLDACHGPLPTNEI